MMKEYYHNWDNISDKPLSERDMNLLDNAVKILKDNIGAGTDIPWTPYRCIMPCRYGFCGIWNWDSAFHAAGVLKWDKELAKEQILGFIEFQCEDGMYPDVIWIGGEVEKKSSKPPVLPWATQKISEIDNDIAFLNKVYPSFVDNERFWTKKRYYNGLFHYGANKELTGDEEYDLYARYESGWDNSVRWDKPIDGYWAVDLNCYMVMYYRAMNCFSKKSGLENDAVIWKNKEKELVKNIEEKMYSEEINSYVDVNRFTGKKSDVLTPASFMPLYIKTATKKRAEAMHRLARDKNKFFPGMPTVAYDNPEYSTDYWRGPTWLNVAYFAAKGLKNYGYSETADEVKETILNWIAKDGGKMYENYDRTGKGMGAPEFSWSAAFVIKFILDF